MKEKIRYEYVLSEKNAIFNEKLKILSKCSFTKALPMATP